MLQQTKNQELNEIIRKIKFLTNLKQSQIAEKIGVSSSYLSDVINERYPFTDKLRVCLYEQFPSELGVVTNNSNNSGNINNGNNNTISYNNKNGNDTGLQKEIESLKKILETKEEMIKELKERLKDKDEIIEMLKAKSPQK